MKSGTTSLHEYLNIHPQIFMSEPKEVHYYTDSNQISEKDYLAMFSPTHKINGTSPQSYTKAHHPDFKGIPERIYKDSPDVKFIYILRDPFERIKSHAIENRYGDKISRIKFNEELGHYWKTSLYFFQLSQYLKYFKKEQFHILSLEALMNDKLGELNEIFNFLGVERSDKPELFEFIKNESSKKQIPYFISSCLWYRVINKLSVTLTEEIAQRLINWKYEDYLKKPSLKSLINEKIVSKVRSDALLLKEEFDFDISLWNLEPKLDE